MSDDFGNERPIRLPESLEHHESLVLFKLASWFQAQVDDALEPAGFKTRHWMTLSVIRHMGPWSQQSVSQKLRIDKATMVAIVNDLEEYGFVTRRRDPADKRLYQISITEAGVEWLDRTEHSIAAVEDSVLAPLNAGERSALLHSMTELLAPPTPSAPGAHTVPDPPH